MSFRTGGWRAPGWRARGWRARGWRLATPAAFAAAGVLLVTSAVNSAGTDLRPGQYDDLTDLARQETARVERLQEQVAEIDREIDELSEEVSSSRLTELQRDIEALKVPAGLTAVEGPGVRVTLNDAPESIRDTAGDEVSNAIVHQQDIQAVVNALWAGGAEAMTIQGQRVISTTGIKCIGNTVLLHGVTYSPPYVIEAIGDPRSMVASIDSNAYIAAYLQAVDQWQLGWELDTEERISAPAFEGSTDMRRARPAGEGVQQS